MGDETEVGRRERREGRAGQGDEGREGGGATPGLSSYNLSPAATYVKTPAREEEGRRGKLR